ncbi:tetratricopeptide repeat protein [Mesonia aquimarina]|uniref:tetratricopeptide repeat protein n=1 Tax=Mesonia aquimarina TaxID=1504967 RepID=UPI000EF59BD8|nr:tetratricopeptide repeat protein [Mesonia aquimarina]
MRFFISILFFLFSSFAFSQSLELAKNYFEQGEYEKAKSVYKKLYQENPRNLQFTYGLISSMQELAEYEEVENILLNNKKQLSIYPNLLVELGYNYQLQEENEAAEKYYRQAIDKVNDQPNYAYPIGNAFQKYSLLEEAVQVYEISLSERPNASITVQLARIYGEQGQIEKMFNSFIKLIEEKPEYFYAVNRNFSAYVTEDPENEANQVLRKLLLKKIQQEPKVLYNELLSWLFTQQNDFKKAFIQEKAIAQRSPEKNLSKISSLALIAAEAGEIEDAKEILNYVTENAATDRNKIAAYGNLMQIKIDNSSSEDIEKIEEDFQQIFESFGKENETFQLQIQYAKFLAFNKDEKNNAEELLNNLLAKNINRFQEANIKMVLGDILVLEEKFNQALIYYSQVQKLVENTELAQEARYKVAQTSYYKGDFDWAQTQLKILKTSTSQLIANDALQLNLLISDNSQEDSTQTALKLFAKADLYKFQQKDQQAFSILDSILQQHKGEKIEDEALFRKAQLLESQQKYAMAEAAYQKIVQYFGQDILADDAHYFLAELYQNQLNQSEEAKKHYEEIIFNFADSIYFVESRKKYRKLRGDAIE